MTFVVDSSVALTWCFAEERTPETAALLERAEGSGAVVPSLWPLEVLNALLMAEKRKRIDKYKRYALIDALHALPITLDAETVTQAWVTTNRLAERYRLTLYDATYLELAQRLDLPLATLDADLRGAASALGVPLLGAPGDSA
ncbi:MAG: type II toxin-antitoxin system VapC family toxin [Proteobacteria bacterium]|nr:type II toxin-antitoxin system VapC family toxin [Pseudomonadota bacterium]MCL2307190.1 type II toxin-antitoxin system VapC family toxin [Pseudomonadota bacterium]